MNTIVTHRHFRNLSLENIFERGNVVLYSTYQKLRSAASQGLLSEHKINDKEGYWRYFKDGPEIIAKRYTYNGWGENDFDRIVISRDLKRKP